jgi:hypothetical protein
MLLNILIVVDLEKRNNLYVRFFIRFILISFIKRIKMDQDSYTTNIHKMDQGSHEGPAFLESSHTTNIHKKFGYNNLPEHIHKKIIEITRLEHEILQSIDNLEIDHDKRWLAIGKTDIEKGFMAIRRAISRPT